MQRVEYQKQPNEKPVEIDKQNLKSSHFNFGNQNPSDKKGFYTTSLNIHYPEHPNVKTTLAQEQLDGLRANHFILGQQHGDRVSFTHQTFNSKEITPGIQKEQEKFKKKMRSHNHSFAESTH